MAAHRLGDTGAAKADWDLARLQIDRAFSPELPAAFEPLGQNQGFWWDWVIARVLFREASTLIQRAG